MDTLPVKILAEIAEISEQSYRGIAFTMRLFALRLTPDEIINWQIHFGHTVEITAEKIEWKRNGKLHRLDGPAVEYSNWLQWWYRNGEIHRDVFPAIIHPDGSQYWYQNNKCHRDDGPAETHASGVQRWYQNNELHRNDGPAEIDLPEGTQRWYQNGKISRGYPSWCDDAMKDEGPAVIHSDGTQEWYFNGKRHRIGEPAIVHPSGIQHWYHNGMYLRSK